MRRGVGGKEGENGRNEKEVNDGMGRAKKGREVGGKEEAKEKEGVDPEGRK